MTENLKAEKKELRKEILRAARKRVAARLKPKKDWIEVVPYGLVVSPGQTRPVMVFKDKTEKHVLPVWMSPADASVAMSQSGAQLTDASPHRIAMKVLKPLGITLKSCFFKEVRGLYQIVDLHFEGDERVQTIEARADEAISFCLGAKAQFFTTAEFVHSCRRLEGEMVNAVMQTHSKSPVRGKNEYLN